MGQCVTGSVRITTANEQKTNNDFTKSLISAATNRNIAGRIAHDVNTGAFYKYFSSDKEFMESANGSIFNLNRNTFKKYVRIYEKQVYPSVTIFAYKRQVNSKGFFDGFDSKTAALNYTADLIISVYNRIAFNTGNTKLQGKKVAENIKQEVQNQILTELIKRAIVAAQQANKSSIESKLRELGNKIEQLKKGLKEAQRQYIIAKNNKNADQITLWGDRYLKVQAAIDANIEEILMHSNNIFKEEIDSRENQNYWALARNIFGKNEEKDKPYYVDWFRQVAYLPKVFDVINSFNALYESEKRGTVKNYDDYNLESLLNEDELFSFDASTASWSDSLYNDFIQHYDNRLKLYLNGLFKLNSTIKIDGEYDYAHEDKLGVCQTMGAGFIIAQLVAFGNFSSVNAFIDSVKSIAENVPDCAGLIKLADDMENDRSFANMVASNLAKPAIIKNMLIYDGQNFNIVHSNQNAYNSTQIFNRLMGISKITINSEYDETINDKVDDYLQIINKITNPTYFVDSREKIGKFILDYFEKYFVGINPDIISNYYYTTNINEILPRAKRLLEIIGLYNKQIDKVKKDINKEKERVRLTRKKQKEQRELAILSGEFKNNAIYNNPVQFNPDAINYNPIVSVIGQLSKLLSGQMPSNIELNSGNAENNMSSDIIKNSYLTNFLKQLNYIIENPDGSETQRGVELLKDFLLKKGNDKKTSYYEYSTILFGIPNPLWRKGSQVPKYLREGLFIKEDNGAISISPNAKNIINVILFNGAKNTNIRVGQLYQNMSSSDYFTNIIASYFNPINYNREYGDGTNGAVKDYCQVLLRIPSDATNQYAIQMPKYSTDGLYNYDTDSTKNFVEERFIAPYLSLKGVYDSFTKKVSTNLYDDYKLNTIFKGKGANIINAEQAAHILFDGGINDSINLHKYYTENGGKVLPLLVKSGNNSFIIYLESKDIIGKVGKNYKITGISSVDGTRIVKKDPLLMEDIVTIQFTPVDQAIRNFFTVSNLNVANEFAFDHNGTSRQYNKNSVIYQGLKTQLFGELNNFFNAISDIFESIEDSEGNIHYVSKTNTKGLFEWYHYNPKKSIVEDGKFTGNIFNFTKLPNVNGYNAGEEISKILNLYGKDGLFKDYGNGRLELNLDRIDLINSDLSGNLNNISDLFDDVLSNWLNNHAQYVKEESSKYATVTQRYSQSQIYEAVINQTLAYMEFDDLFEGSSKYYADAQTFLKRDKEVQAGGQAYMGGVDVSDDIGAPIHDMNDNNGNPLEILISDKRKGKDKYPISTINFVNGDLVEGNLTARNGFRAVTIYNTNTTFDIASTIYDTLKERLEKVEGQTEENAAKIAKNIADGFGFSGSKTKVNDAQSYITFEEFIRRKWMDGTLSEYKDLIAKILDENYTLTEQDYADINRKIQVQKNFYYDMAYDNNTGVYYPRQIKNAEFVLIPRFIKGTELEQLYNIMKENDINQINTIETSKAANINTLEFWDNNGEAHADKFKEALKNTPESIQTYYYRYLYKQQDVVDHIDNEENKAGIQVLKKILDNVVQPNIELELENIKKKAIDNGTFMKAPNGKKTNLTEKQWLQVRTKAFKNWFGDWENNPSEASKVIDENGEPLVLYHGSDNFGFNEFKKSDDGISYFFTSDKATAKSYIGKFSIKALNVIDDIWDLNISDTKYITKENAIKTLDLIKDETFKKILIEEINNLSEETFEVADIDEDLKEYNEKFKKLKEELTEKYKDTNKEDIPGYKKELEPKDFWEDDYTKEKVINNLVSEKLSKRPKPYKTVTGIKLDKYLTNKNDKVYEVFLNIKNPNTIDAKGSNWNQIFTKDGIINTREFHKQSVNNKFDGSIIVDIRDLGADPNDIENTISPIETIDYGDHIEEYYSFNHATLFVVSTSNQIKSATDNSGLFQTNNNDIYDKENKLLKAVETIQDNLTKNIEEDYNELMTACGWHINDDGFLVNDDNQQDIKFDEFYRRARQEASRLGMDSNFLDYITPDDTGRIKMPTFMNNISSKLESIAQSVFNNSIVRQTLPGFHAVQVTNVGYSRKLRYIVEPDGGVTCQIMVAPWSDEIKQMIAKYGKQETIKKLEKIGADTFVGYRIPTEGKQSIIKMKVIDFLDPAQGSTIIVPNEWVAQTGSDFDIDTIYSIVHELGIESRIDSKKVKKIRKTPDGKEVEVEETEETHVDEFVIKNKGRAGRNNQILEAFKTILSDASAFEENMSRSNFDDIDNAIDKYNPKNADASVYDVFTEIKFMENAIAGLKLKAFSVNRDTFNSISNTVHGVIQQSNIKAIYDLSKIDKDNLIAAYGDDHIVISDDGKYATVIHDKIGWSYNNRNVVGKLVTPYSSQTTAHILDAIKKGTIFNETDYTFGSFKTLIDLGIDYDTAVSFLAQQAITDLNNEYFKVNSVFTNTYPTIIENVYRSFAQKQNFTYEGSLIGNNASFKIVMKAISNNENFVKNYCDYWGIKSIDEIPALSEEKFAKALKDKSNNPYHYFGVLQIFSNLKQKTDIIEDIAQCSRPDATGAKQTVRATRKLLDNIREYTTDEEHGIIISESGNRFLEDLYGLEFKNSDEQSNLFNVNLDKAKYKYLAAILKYGIQTSVTANKRLFLFAGDQFTTLTKVIEDRIGRELNDDEFNLFKKYYVSSLYAGLELINAPIILDENNNIISNPNYGIYGPNFWDTERSRVFGYIEPAENGDNFTVNNFGNPTPLEIENYNKLTPLQKVVFLKKTLPYDDNIFNKLYVSKTSDRNYKEKGYTNNKISINIDNVNIESIYQQFRDAFFNDNPLIRLAAIDLIKYAMLVEGYNYKNGSITKIIPNQCLLGEINDRGLDIITKLNDDFVSKLADENEYADKFIRSHSELIRAVQIDKPSSKEGQTTLGDVLNRYREKIEVIKIENNSQKLVNEYSGYISIPVSEETLDLRNALKLNNNQKTPKYIKLNSATEASGKTTAALYKVIPITAYDRQLDKDIVTHFNLIPLNLLEENEWSDISINNNNNSFYNYGFYIALHPENKFSYDIVPPIIMTNDVIDDAANRPERYVRQVSESKNTNTIENLVNEEKDSYKKNLAIHVRDQILNWYNNDRVNLNGAQSFGIIQAYGSFVYDVLGIDKDAPRKGSVQDIILDDEGTILSVNIVPLTGSLFGQIKAIKNRYRHRAATEYINDFAERNDIFYEQKTNNKVNVEKIPAGLFRIIPIIKASNEELLESNDDIKDASPDGMFSKFGGLLDEIRYKVTGTKPTDEVHDVSTLIMRELQYQKNHGNESVANELGLLSIKGFIPNDSVSLEEYKVDIYKIAAKYYRDAADRILKRLEQFSCNGSLYSVDEDELYDALREDPSKVNELYHLILEASTFGNQISPVNDVDYVGEDDETNKNIQKIQRAIKDVRNNKKIHKAFDNIYNIYLAKEYANNPNVRLGIIAMTDIFGDSDWFAANIGDVTHLNHKQIQVVTKIATQELEKARLVAADEVADFEEWWNGIEQELGKDVMIKTLDKLIDSQGIFIQPFTKQYLEDREAWKEKLAKVEKFGKTSLEYLKVKHERDKWFLDNVSRQYVKEYYKEQYDNEDYILKASPKLYSEYLTVEAEYLNLSKFATLDDKQRVRKRVLAEKMSDLRTNAELDSFLQERANISDKYFEYIESDDFRNTLEKHKEILDRYRQIYKDKTLWEMYTSPDEEFARFRDSYDWIKCNTVYEFSDEAKKAIFNAFKVLKTVDDRKKRPVMQIINKFDKDKRLDASGEIIGTLYSLDDARAIRDILRRKYNPYGEVDEEGNLIVPLYTENKEAYDSDANLIKDVPQTPIFKESLFTDFLLDEDERTSEIRTTKRKLYTKINNIIKKGIVNKKQADLGYGSVGDISARLLVEACTEEELMLLGNLYRDLRTVSKAASRIYSEDVKETKDSKRPFVYKTNNAALRKQHKFIVNQSGNIRQALENIFYEKDKDGLIITKKKMPVGNKFIYGYIDLHKDSNGNYTKEAQKYIDKEKTDARKLLDENIEYKETQYYYQAYENAKLQGEDYFNEWYDANHVYNPYKHDDEPIPIWTVMRANPAGSLKAKADYVANRDNMQKTPKDGTLNPNFDPIYKASYNEEGNYTNEVFKNLTDKEKEILKKLQDVAAKYAINNNQKRFLKRGFAPRVYEKDTDWVDTLNDVANVFGLGNRSSVEKDWHQDVDFEHDFDLHFSMYDIIKTKGYQKPPVLRKQAVFETDEEYAKYKEDWKKQVKEINEANFKLDNAAFSKNWKEVYKRLIEEGNQYATKTRLKDLLYLTLQDLRQRKAYSTTQRRHGVGDLIKRSGTSTIQQEDFYKTEQTRAIDTFQNWIRRVLYGEYKNYTVYNKAADRIQTMNSAKFMMFNLMSGINNVTVGLVNMAMEGFSGDYFTKGSLRRGMAKYMLNVGGFATHFATGVAPNETVALLEMFNVEDYDKSQAAFQDFKTNAVDKFNDAAYGFLSSGEHFMRNSAMLAMLESHKLYLDPADKKHKRWVVGTEKDYLQSIELGAIETTLKQLAEEYKNENSEDANFYRDLADYYYTYIAEIKNDKQEAMKFDRLQKDILNGFIRSSEFNRYGALSAAARKKKFVQTYLSVKKDLIAEGKKEFAGFQTVKENLYYDEKQKRERIYKDSHLTLNHVAEIIDKAKSINKKIHGVYDKLGAAKIERYCLGSLIMQYKKHLYPGFMKHWRKKGYYNEHRGTNEYGMFQSLFDWLIQDFRYKDNINNVFKSKSNTSDEESSQWAAMNIFEKLINNAVDLGINWQMLPDWQKRNVIRFAGDIGGILVALGIIMAIYAFMDDDDLRKSKLANEALYLADRLYGESSMYGILLSGGLWTEFSNFLAKPIVAMDFIYDAFKMKDYVLDYAFNGENYKPNYKRGTYKGENKMWVVLRRNIPGWRQWNQWKHITSHNNYYKINESNFGQTLFKNIGKSLRGTDIKYDRENSIETSLGLINR